MVHETIYDVYWEGPYTVEYLKTDLSKTQNENYVLYKIYGTHPVYGRDVLLYIGMTKQGLKERLKQHDDWIDNEFDPCKIYVASVGKFESWKKAGYYEIYEALDSDTIKKVESILIFAHQPVYNTRSKKNAEDAKNIRVFNTGRLGSLMPEISGLYYFGD